MLDTGSPVEFRHGRLDPGPVPILLPERRGVLMLPTTSKTDILVGVSVVTGLFSFDDGTLVECRAFETGAWQKSGTVARCRLFDLFRCHAVRAGKDFALRIKGEIAKMPLLLIPRHGWRYHRDLMILQRCLAIAVAAVQGIGQYFFGRHILPFQFFKGRQEGIGIMLIR